MKAIIPVAGTGARLRPHTYTQPKPLIPVAGKPILAFIIDALKGAGINDYIFVVGYLEEKIRAFIAENYPDINAEFVVQEQRDGLGHAIWVARDLIQHEENILIVLGDTVFETDLKPILNAQNTVLAVKEVTDPREFGVVELNDAQKIKRVIEKPKIPRSNLALVGIYKICEVEMMLKALNHNIQNDIRTNGEFQLADALQNMIEQGVEMTPHEIKTWFDCGKKEILLETNATLLEKNQIYDVDMPVFDNTIVVHPVSVGKKCIISNSIIGPYVTIGSNTRIESSIIKDSIVGSFSTLNDVVLNHSIVGSDSSVTGARRTLNIGDNTEIDFG